MNYGNRLQLMRSPVTQRGGGESRKQPCVTPAVTVVTTGPVC